MQSPNAIRAVAIFEAIKGALVIAAGCGAFSLLHKNVQQLAGKLIAHLHLNPAKHYPQVFIDAAAHLTDTRLWILAIFAALYGVVRLAEAYGLWNNRRWAEWFAAISGGIYVPFELYELYSKASWLSLTALVANTLIVALMVKTLRHKYPK